MENYTIKQLGQLLAKKEILVKDLVNSYFKRIDDLNPRLKAYITLAKEQAYAQAEKAQEMIDKGISKPMTGIPIAIKDNISSKGILTTCASKMLYNYTPVYDATVIEKLKADGAIILGKANMDEFAMGGSTETSYYGETLNPYDLDCVPGGSSGGSAVAVSANMAVCSLGSDTGGSIRQPAAFCGVTGLKPTYGRVSRYGLVAFASSLDQIGPIAKSAEDCAIILNAISGKDFYDMTASSREVEDYTSNIGISLKGKTVGLPKEFFETDLSPEVREAVEKAIEVYKGLGCNIKEVSLKSLKFAISSYYLISSAEASSNLARFDGIKYGYRSKEGDTYQENVRLTRDEAFGKEVKRRILIGIYGLSSGYYDDYYNKAVLVRSKIKDEYDAIFSECDFMLSPTTLTPAYKLGSAISDPVKMYQADVLTVTMNIAGLPCISTPCGYSKNGLPIGLQLTAAEFKEKELIAYADAYEQYFKSQRKEAIL